MSVLGQKMRRMRLQVGIMQDVVLLVSMARVDFMMMLVRMWIVF